MVPNVRRIEGKFHLSNVFRKLRVHDRYSLADSLRATANRRVILEESEAEEIRGVAGAASTTA